MSRRKGIGAAIALVRFRIKMDTKNFAMCLFYGIIIGMACGVEQVELAYGLAGIFAVLQFTMLGISKILNGRVGPTPSTKSEISISGKNSEKSVEKIVPGTPALELSSFE